MIKFLESDPWKVEVREWNPDHVMRCESVFSVGNGRFGQRANFEESYSGETLQGSYVAGVYYPDKTRVGWWKNGYPEYFAKVLNSVNWIGLSIKIDGVALDLNEAIPEGFVWGIDMKRGVLYRSFSVSPSAGIKLKISSQRFCSMKDDEVAAIRYQINVLEGNPEITIASYLDANVVNHDSNWDDAFWSHGSSAADTNGCVVVSTTNKSNYTVAAASRNSSSWSANSSFNHSQGFAEEIQQGTVEGDELVFDKFVGLVSSLDYAPDETGKKALEAAARAQAQGFDNLLSEHETMWSEIWELADIQIDGDVEAQQAIRFNIFHLNQTYTGTDARLNIGPKGFTGEKYGGSTYWDTEAYCLPFYMNTKGDEVARQLLVYRYHHLEKAIENAEKLGFSNGAALYPMVTINGEECHNEWEITFEEIHRNGAIAFAIFNYIRHTGDAQYLVEYGWDVLLGIARFWSQRVNWSEHKQKFVMLGVTGPNEYENNVNNNWYTNYIASWCMRYAAEAFDWMKQNAPDALAAKIDRWNFDESELEDWKNRVEKMYYPEMEGTRVKLQQDGFLDKELMNADDLDDSERPINQYWSWDRILRSVFIKQADVLQGMYFLEHEFDLETIRENFDFYEPKTVHESSLSPCVHSIQAALLDKMDKAYEMYMRTSRLDLDDYNHEVHEGLHITSMAGTWMSIVEGFGGLRVKDDMLHFTTRLPEEWRGFAFNVNFRGRTMRVSVDTNQSRVDRLRGEEIDVVVNGEVVRV